MIYFYARVSTKDQNLARQLEAANYYSAHYKPIDRIFTDKQSGKNFDREDYNELKHIVLPGDEVVVEELDRLGRNKEAIKDEIKWFRTHGVILRIMDIPTTLIDFQGQDWIADMVNNVMIEVLASVAQREREKTLQRQREGIDAMPVVNGKKISTKTGRAYGRQYIDINDEFSKFLQKQKDGELTVQECCDRLGISRSLWYSRLREVTV